MKCYAQLIPVTTRKSIEKKRTEKSFPFQCAPSLINQLKLTI